MKNFPGIIELGNIQSLQVLQTIDLPSFNKKYSIASYQTQFTAVNNNSLATLSTPPIRQQDLSFKKQQKQCRICLQNSIENQNQLIKICKCSGSVQFVHEQCYISWIQTLLQNKNKQERNKILKKKQIQCQMCKQKINVYFQEEKIFADRSHTINNIKKNRKMFIFILLLFLATLSSVIYLIVRMSSQGVYLNSDNDKFFSSLFSICSIILLIVLNCISIFFIIEQFFVFIHLKVKLVKRLSSQGIRKNSLESVINLNQTYGQLNPESPLHINNNAYKAEMKNLRQIQIKNKMKQNGERGAQQMNEMNEREKHKKQLDIQQNELKKGNIESKQNKPKNQKRHRQNRRKQVLVERKSIDGLIRSSPEITFNKDKIQPKPKQQRLFNINLQQVIISDELCESYD